MLLKAAGVDAETVNRPCFDLNGKTYMMRPRREISFSRFIENVKADPNPVKKVWIYRVANYIGERPMMFVRYCYER